MPVSEKPRARALAIVDVLRGRPGTTSLTHSRVNFSNEQARLFLPLLDGTHTQEELAHKLVEQYKSGCLDLTENGLPLGQSDDPLPAARLMVAAGLASYSRLHMLEA
jgi:hypothetical protein